MFGRTKILFDEQIVTDENVCQILSDALTVHRNNAVEIHTLYNYYKGNQAILNRKKLVRPEICNKIVENRANEIITFKTGYLCGEPIQYVSRSSDPSASEEIGDLNDLMTMEGKPSKDKDLVEWMYIAGTAYRMVQPNSSLITSQIVPKLQNRQTDFAEDESPFNIYTLDPRYTGVVYYSGLGEEPIMAFKSVVQAVNSIGTEKNYLYSVWTKDKYYEIEGTAFSIGNVPRTIENHTLGAVPIIEYPLNNARLGVFETVMPILDAINTVQSNRLDGIEQFIQNLTILYNCDIDDENALKLRESGLIKLTTSGIDKADIKVISEQLDQMQTQTLVDYMYQTILNIVGMPNRNGGSSTSDTGSAVIMRDGWESAEARAKCDELTFKEPENQFLKLVLRILRETVGTNLMLKDIDIHFTRRNSENALSKSQILTTMLANPKIAPILAFTHCGMFSDAESAYQISEKYYREYMDEMQEQAVLNGSGGTNKNGETGGDNPVAGESLSQVR